MTTLEWILIGVIVGGWLTHWVMMGVARDRIADLEARVASYKTAMERMAERRVWGVTSDYRRETGYNQMVNTTEERHERTGACATRRRVFRNTRVD